MTFRIVGSPDRVCEWITISLAQDSKTAKRHLANLTNAPWLGVLQALVARRGFDGYDETWWSHVEEKPDQVWIWTFWRTQAAYQAQQNSPQYHHLVSKLCTLSASPPGINALEISTPYGNYSRRALLMRARPSVTLCSFPSSLDPAQREKIKGLRGLDYRYHDIYGRSTEGFMHSSPQSPHSSPHTNPDAPLSETATVFVIIEWWKDRKGERKGRGSLNSPSFPQQCFEKRLEDAGCLEKCVRHTCWTEARWKEGKSESSPKHKYYTRYAKKVGYWRGVRRAR